MRQDFSLHTFLLLVDGRHASATADIVVNTKPPNPRGGDSVAADAIGDERLGLIC